MSHHATFTYPAGAERYEVRLEIGGRVDLTVYGAHGKVVERHTSDIDTRDSHRLVTDLFSIAAALPPDSFGDRELAVSDGVTTSAFAFSEYNLPARGLEVARIIHTIATDVRASYAPRSARSAGGPGARKASPADHLKWGVYFALIYLAARATNIGIALVGALSGPLGFAISAALCYLLPLLAFYRLGERFGEEYRGESEVLIPCILGTGTVFVVMFVLDPLTIFGAIGAILLPVFAKRGQLSVS